VGRRVQIALVAVVGAFLVLAVAAYAIDRVNSDQIADGVRIADVEVGGLSIDEARERLQARLAEPLEKTVTVSFEDTEYRLSPDRLELRADVEGMIDAALDASRSGVFPTRAWRYATGGSVDREIAPQMAYSAEALDGFLSEVTDEINRPPRDATVEPSPASLNPVPAQDGVTVRVDNLRSRLRSAIDNPDDRTVSVPADRVKPGVSTNELARKYPAYITIDRAAFQLRLWKKLKLAKTYTIAVGAAGYETSTGVYNVESKQVNPTWYVPDAAWAGDLAGEVVPPGPDNPLQARWMGFFEGAGIHGTNDIGSLGSAASHGCIRMAVSDVVELYDQVPLGTPIYIGN
jgi:lipoprotein-anchoring transpeptidase ErfK/SrfK